MHKAYRLCVGLHICMYVLGWQQRRNELTAAYLATSFVADIVDRPAMLAGYMALPPDSGEDQLTSSIWVVAVPIELPP